MSQQKFLLNSQTVLSAILTFLIAVCPLLLEGVNGEFNEAILTQLISLTITFFWNIHSRYRAQTTLYTPRGLPGRDYIPAYKQRD